MLRAITQAAQKQGVSTRDYLCGVLRRGSALDELQRKIECGLVACECGAKLRLEGTQQPNMKDMLECGVSAEEAVAMLRTRCSRCGAWSVLADEGDLLDAGDHIGQEEWS